MVLPELVVDGELRWRGELLGELFGGELLGLATGGELLGCKLLRASCDKLLGPSCRGRTDGVCEGELMGLSCWLVS